MKQFFENSINALESSITCSIIEGVREFNSSSGEMPITNDNKEIIIPLGNNSPNWLKKDETNGRVDIRDYIQENILESLTEIDSTPEFFFNFIKNMSTEHLLIYGMLIIEKTGERYNPFHPFIAKAISKGDIVLPSNFKIVIYSFVNNVSNVCMRNEDLTLIADSLTLYGNKNSKTSRSTLESPSDIARKFTNKNTNLYDLSFSYNEHNENKYCLVPIQKMSRGIVYPYYGLVSGEFSNTYGYRTMNIYPIMSGNISNAGSFTYSSTCLGGGSPMVYKEMSVLNDMNIDSLYHDYLFSSSTRANEFILACQAVSISLLTSEKNTEPIEVIDESLITEVAMPFPVNEIILDTLDVSEEVAPAQFEAVPF